MNLKPCHVIKGAYTVHVDANELMCDVKFLSYPTTIGLVFLPSGGRPHGGFQHWTPAAPVPRGYVRSAKATLRMLSEWVSKYGVGAVNAKLAEKVTL